MGKGDRALRFLVNAILPGKDQDDDLGPRRCGIPQEHLTLSVAPRSPSSFTLPPWLIIFDASRVFSFKRRFIGTTGSWDRVLIFSLLSHGKPAFRGKSQSERCFEWFFWFSFFTRAVCCSSDNHPPRSILITPHHHHHTHTWSLCHALVLSLSSMIFFLVLPFHVRELFTRVFCSTSFFFHAGDSLTRMFTVEKKKRNTLLPSRTAAGKETNHNK